MTMPNAPALDQAGLDQVDPATHSASDATHFREIAAAAKTLQEDERRLVDAVRRAREAGDSWTIIGAALGMTRQGAYQRFGRSLGLK
jgi:hypothetical protein